MMSELEGPAGRSRRARQHQTPGTLEGRDAVFDRILDQWLESAAGE